MSWLSLALNSPFRGKMLRVVSGAGRGVRLHNSEIVAAGDPGRVAPRIQGFSKKRRGHGWSKHQIDTLTR